jgi:hypothetical protein
VTLFETLLYNLAMGRVALVDQRPTLTYYLKACFWPFAGTLVAGFCVGMAIIFAFSQNLYSRELRGWLNWSRYYHHASDQALMVFWIIAVPLAIHYLLMSWAASQHRRLDL